MDESLIAEARFIAPLFIIKAKIKIYSINVKRFKVKT